MNRAVNANECVLSEGGGNITKTFSDLYETSFPLVARFVATRRGSFDDAKDLFHDALVIFQEKQNAGIEIQISETAYLLGIVKHLWLRKNKADRKMVTLDDHESSIDIPDDYFASFNTTFLSRFLEQTGKRCMELLKYFYYDRESASAVAKTLGYRSTHSATVQKFKCLEKMREQIKQKSMSYEDFLE